MTSSFAAVRVLGRLERRRVREYGECALSMRKLRVKNAGSGSGVFEGGETGSEVAQVRRWSDIALNRGELSG